MLKIYLALITARPVNTADKKRRVKSSHCSFVLLTKTVKIGQFQFISYYRNSSNLYLFRTDDLQREN